MTQSRQRCAITAVQHGISADRIMHNKAISVSARQHSTLNANVSGRRSRIQIWLSHVARSTPVLFANAASKRQRQTDLAERLPHPRHHQAQQCCPTRQPSTPRRWAAMLVAVLSRRQLRRADAADLTTTQAVLQAGLSTTKRDRCQPLLTLLKLHGCFASCHCHSRHEELGAKNPAFNSRCVRRLLHPTQMPLATRPPLRTLTRQHMQQRCTVELAPGDRLCAWRQTRAVARAATWKMSLVASAKSLNSCIASTSLRGTVSSQYGSGRLKMKQLHNGMCLEFDNAYQHRSMIEEADNSKAAADEATSAADYRKWSVQAACQRLRVPGRCASNA